jgi:hypothetical protein
MTRGREGARQAAYERMFPPTSDGRASARVYNRGTEHSPGDWSNGKDGGLQNRRSGFDSLVPRLERRRGRHEPRLCVDDVVYASRP